MRGILDAVGHEPQDQVPESFRPFAPSVLRERLSDYFEMDADSPYMLLVAPVLAGRRTPLTDDQRTCGASSS
jgi:hypothetical protein